MAGVDSSLYKLYISSDGTNAGTKQELEAQGDITFNLGRGTERVVSKNATHSYITDSGAEISTEFVEQRPLGTAQSTLWAAHDSKSAVYAWVEDATAGGMMFHGAFKCAISEISSPAEGLNMHRLTLSAEGDITRGTVSAS